MTEYRKVSLYDPATKRGKIVKVKKSDFATPEELDAYVKKLQADNRAKNAELKKQRKLQNTQHELPITPAPQPEPTVTQMPTLQVDPKTGSTYVIFGSSKRGKSTLLMHLYKKYYQDSKYISTLFSGNPQLKVYKSKYLNVVYGFGRDHANGIRAQQYIQVKTKNRYRFLNMFDDIIDQKKAPVIADMMMTYRNSNISMMIALQYSFLLSKENRSNVNHTFIFGMNTHEDIENIINVFLRPYFAQLGYSTLVDQIAFFKKITTDHGYIYVNNLTSEISFHRL